MDRKYPPAMKTSVNNPDLDWSQVRETILMLGVAVGQIEMVMRDGNESIGVLTDSFTAMSGAVHAISEAAHDLPDDEATRIVRQSIDSNSAFVAEQMQKAIVAFQFYDRMAQRLDHVCHSIDALADLIADTRRLYSPDEWASIQDKIRSKYTIESERVMFDAIVNGASVHDALELAKQHAADVHAGSSDIELF